MTAKTSGEWIEYANKLAARAEGPVPGTASSAAISLAQVAATLAVAQAVVELRRHFENKMGR